MSRELVPEPFHAGVWGDGPEVSLSRPDQADRPATRASPETRSFGGVVDRPGGGPPQVAPKAAPDLDRDGTPVGFIPNQQGIVRDSLAEVSDRRWVRS
jgi:hypothetical protein